jgi:hypothetical protein
MELIGVYHSLLASMTQPSCGLSGMVEPGGSRPRYSPGISPSSQTERASIGSVPMPWSRTHAAALSPISRKVTAGVASVGLSSR